MTEVVNGGVVSDRKGVNVPSVLLPISAMTAKDRDDLDFGLRLGVDWVALSFVQRPQDVHEVRAITGDRVGVLVKLEKPAAIEALEAIGEAADAIMVARGDLGVELPAEQVPRIQKQIVRSCRAAGKPVIVATQMLESMITASMPTRAEASDVATAIYEGADAVMLSAESASGRLPRDAVAMMDRIITEVESDPYYIASIHASQTPAQGSVADAVCLDTASRQLAVGGRHRRGSRHGRACLFTRSAGGLCGARGHCSDRCRHAIRHRGHDQFSAHRQGLTGIDQRDSPQTTHRLFMRRHFGCSRGGLDPWRPCCALGSLCR